MIKKFKRSNKKTQTYQITTQNIFANKKKAITIVCLLKSSKAVNMTKMMKSKVKI